MNWNQAKNILLVLFIVINLVLVVIIQRTIPEDKVSSQTIKNTVLALTDRNIEVLCTVPNETPKMAIFRYNSKTEETPDYDTDIQKLYSEDQIMSRNVEIVEEKRIIMSANHVLLKNFTFNEGKQSITAIKSGYLQRSTKSKNNEEQFLPVWCIITKVGNVKYFKAFTGEEVTL